MKKRESQFELLRIIAMVMIISFHYVVHSGFKLAPAVIPPQTYYLFFLAPLGKIGVSLFILITGYFLIMSDNPVSYKKILKLWGQVAFISVVLLLIASKGLGIMELDKSTLISNFLPITSNKYWFITQYFVLYCFTPFLNKLFRSLDKASFQKFLTICFILFSLITTITTYRGGFFCNITWFVFMYAFGSYIRLHGFCPNLKPRHHLGFFVFFLLLMFAMTSIKMSLKGDFPFLNDPYYFGYQNSIFSFFVAISLFMFFAKIKIPYSPVINALGSATFGVYLLHDNEYTRFFLFKDVLHCANYQDSFFLIAHGTMVIFGIYLVCSLIELIRIYTIEKLFMMLVDKCRIFQAPISFVYNLGYSLLFGIENKAKKKEE